MRDFLSLTVRAVGGLPYGIKMTGADNGDHRRMASIDRATRSVSFGTGRLRYAAAPISMVKSPGCVACDSDVRSSARCRATPRNSICWCRLRRCNAQGPFGAGIQSPPLLGVNLTQRRCVIEPDLVRIAFAGADCQEATVG